MFAPPSVVQPYDRRPHESCTTECEHIVRGVVEQYGDVRRTIGVEPGAVQRGKSLGFEEELFVSPHLIAETKCRAAGIAGVSTVASEKGGDVPGRERDLAERWCEHKGFGHFSRYPRRR